MSSRNAESTMVQQTGNPKGVIRSLDWWTIAIYIALLVFGWVSVCGASYDYGDTDLFSLNTRSGMQVIWIGTSIMLGFVILLLDDRYLDMFAYIIFGFMLLLLFGTIFNPHSIKGSRSWLVQVEGFCNLFGHRIVAYALHRLAARDGLCTGLFGFFPYVLS